MLDAILPKIILQVWWNWDSEDPSLFSFCYHWFNLTEGFIWVVFAGLVHRRFLMERRSSIEPAYAGLFLAFGISDFQEAWEQSTWLICLKLINILLLFRVRRHNLDQFYPSSRLY